MSSIGNMLGRLARLETRCSIRTFERRGRNSQGTDRQALWSGVMQKQTARIENWARVGDHLVGSVSYDLHRDQPVSTEFQRTSRIVKIDEDAGICETQNTIYRLGRAVRPIPGQEFLPR